VEIGLYIVIVIIAMIIAMPLKSLRKKMTDLEKTLIELKEKIAKNIEELDLWDFCYGLTENEKINAKRVQETAARIARETLIKGVVND
jgi:predicted transcriptional regulator